MIATDKRVAKFLKGGAGIEINDLVTLVAVQLEGEGEEAETPSGAPTPPTPLTPPLPSPSASTHHLSLGASSLARASLNTKLRNLPSRDSSAPRPSPSKPTLEGLLGFGFAHALPSLSSPSQNSGRPECHNFDLKKRSKELAELRFEWRKEERSRKDWTVSVMGCPPIALSSHSPLPHQTDHESPSSSPAAVRRKASGSLLTAQSTVPLPYKSVSAASSLVDLPSFSRSSTTSADSTTPSPLTPSSISDPTSSGRWTLWLRMATPYGHKDLYLLATLTPTPHHLLLVAHISAPRLPKELPEELGFDTDELEECRSVLCLWLLSREADSETGKRQGSK